MPRSVPKNDRSIPTRSERRAQQQASPTLSKPTTPKRPKPAKHGSPAIMRKTQDSYERQSKAVAMRSAGASYDQIAQALGYHDRSTAFRAIQTRLDELHRHCLLKTAEYVELERGKLDALERRLNQMIREEQGLAAKDRIAAMRELRAVSESRRRLDGLDAAQKVDHTFKARDVDVDALSHAQLTRLAAGDFGVLREAPAEGEGQAGPHAQGRPSGANGVAN